jgi:hypothetical protein
VLALAGICVAAVSGSATTTARAPRSFRWIIRVVRGSTPVRGHLRVALHWTIPAYPIQGHVEVVVEVAAER